MVDLEQELREKLNRAAQIYKFDLVTQMVNEFPELEGRMGEVYARLAGEDEAVARAIYEHYLPKFSGDRVPQSAIGAIWQWLTSWTRWPAFWSRNDPQRLSGSICPQKAGYRVGCHCGGKPLGA